ncbi:hypothetical protein E2C01_001625 [Portunus trituberculatus]|uniref:Uncharacterized protein n=1 Tax=Portunus trituberculatus TaxID=210409 RepID=A0A5B7CMZ0_PORTR|nr:hypothetical protein [Portunus trituberculatus]
MGTKYASSEVHILDSLMGASLVLLCLPRIHPRTVQGVYGSPSEQRRRGALAVKVGLTLLTYAFDKSPFLTALTHARRYHMKPPMMA